MTRLARLSLLGMIIVLSAHAALADNSYALKRQIAISGNALTLADLIDGPDVPTDPVFGAPAPGETGTIQPARIAAAFKKATGKTLALADADAVVVTRRARILTERDLAQSLARLIARDFKIDDPEIRLQFEAERTGIAVDEGAKGAPLISNLRLDPQSLRFEAQLTMPDDARLTAKPIMLQGYVAADRLVPVLIRTIDKGQPITPDDIRMERRLRSQVYGKTVPALAELSNRVALTDLATGDVLTDDRIGKPTLVEKGGFVTVIYEANGLLLSMRGRATESGALGDVIGFSNPQSKKTLFGTVTGDGQLKVTGYATKDARLDTPPPHPIP